jgi:hypothetical protein
LKFGRTEVYGFEKALIGMRNPKNSWGKNDTKEYICYGVLENPKNYNAFKNEKHNFCRYIENDALCVLIGENDMKLAQTLIKAGSEHRKFMRQIFVSVDITAPLYWWKEFDTYKVGTVANSTSTMHKITSQPITLDCFEIDDYDGNVDCGINKIGNECIGVEFEEIFITQLEYLRQKYLETKDKRYWKELIRWLPESWLQKRTVTMTYENILAMCSKGQRRFHKLNEWSGQDNTNVPNFISWARTLPYAQELIFIDELETK